MKNTGIYMFLCSINNKAYVGSSRNIKNRKWGHLSELRKNKHYNSYLQRAWNKYGEEAFTFSIIENCSEEHLLSREAWWILKLKSNESEFGYNIMAPGYVNKDKLEINKAEKIIPIIDRIVCINLITGEILTLDSQIEVCARFSFDHRRVSDVVRYWETYNNDKNLGKRSYKNWIFTKEDLYDKDFDYYKKKPKIRKKPLKQKTKKEPIPYSERNLKRVPIILTSVDSGEKIEALSIKQVAKELNLNVSKIYKCLKNPDKNYQHKGFYYSYK